MNGGSLAGRLWNASPLRLFGPTTQGDLSLRPSALVKSAGARLAEMIEGAPPIKPAAVPFSVVCVYRRRNASRVTALDLPAGSTFLWALDDPSAELREMTHGVGGGTRFELLNRLLSVRSESDDWLVVIDDDVILTRGTLASTVGTAVLGAFDLCGPSHSRWSYLSWGCTLHRAKSIARTTRFVEMGPCLILSPRAQRSLLPFPEDLAMGWGVEAQWAGHDGLRLGILDAVHLRHERPVGRANYDIDAEWTQASELLARSGFSSWQDMQRTLETWRYGESKPPWLH
jgi:hypothetical protein